MRAPSCSTRALPSRSRCTLCTALSGSANIADGESRLCSLLLTSVLPVLSARSSPCSVSPYMTALPVSEITICESSAMLSLVQPDCTLCMSVVSCLHDAVAALSTAVVLRTMCSLASGGSLGGLGGGGYLLAVCVAPEGERAAACCACSACSVVCASSSGWTIDRLASAFAERDDWSPESGLTGVFPRLSQHCAPSTDALSMSAISSRMVCVASYDASMSAHDSSVAASAAA